MCVAKKIIHKNKTININSDVINLFSSYKQESINDTEACGILMCSIDKNTNDVYISHATEPQSNDIRKRNYFFLKDTTHQNKLNKIHTDSKGTIFLCGTWHTHPEDIPTASMLDSLEWIKFIKGNTNHIEYFYFIIVGKKEIAIYTLENNTLVQLKD